MNGVAKRQERADEKNQIKTADRRREQGFFRGNAAKGLYDHEVETSRKQYGDNTLHMRKGKSFGARFLTNLGDPVIKILLCALGVNLLFLFRNANWFETGGIAVSILLATLISTVSEYGSEAAFKRLSEAYGMQFCRVFRNGTVKEVPLQEIVVGDLLLLGAGEQVPADGILLRGNVTVDQSAMTGESREVEKQPLAADAGAGERLPSSRNALFRGCAVLSGEGEMLVERVGDATFLGGISKEVQIDTRESPLHVRLGKLAHQISRLGYFAAVLVAVVFLINAFILDSGFDRAVIWEKLTDLPYVLQTLLHAFMLGLTVVVMAVPEGLPLMVAVVLSSNIRRMMRDQVLVRKSVGIEAAGSMNILFTDKTGTLTQGILSVGEIGIGDGERFADIGAFAQTGGNCFSLYRESCFLNTDAKAGENASGVPCALGGNATERALLSSVLTVPQVPYPVDRVLFRIPFDSAKKFSAVQTESGYLFIKGAPELLLPHIRYRMGKDGKRTRCGLAEAEHLLRLMLRDGKRVLLIALGDGDIRRLHDGHFGVLTLLCMVTLEDRLRAEAPEAVAALRSAGIHVIMMTGDSRETAGTIARQCGILGDGVDMILESKDLSALSDSRLRVILPQIGVIARALPADKSRLVRVAQEADLVVGMTGDGINDAPALRRADVGFAMGDGTQIAKDAGDIIIMDDNIGSIVKAVLYGRNIFKSIRKFIVLQLMMNFCAVGVSMICPFLGIDAPVTVVQMLWINIIMDTLGGLAFAGEAPQISCMQEKPKRRDQPILNRYMINEIVMQGSFTVALYLIFLKVPFFRNQYREAPDNIYLMTAFFALFIFSSVFNCFNARTDRLRLLSGIEDNKPFVGIMTAVLLIQLVFVYVGGAVLRTAPLTLRELGVTALCALTVFPAEMARKLLWRMRGKKEGY